MLGSDQIGGGFILRFGRREQEHHPAELLATGKTAVISAHCDEVVRTAAFHCDALRALDGFGDSRLSVGRTD